MVRLAHLSDTHLGYAAYTRMSPDGLNQREADTYAAYREAIRQILALAPDLVVHSGDLFDAVRPSNRAIAVAMDGLQRLGAAGIPVVLVAGNHETPRLRETGSVFRLLEFLPRVHAVYRGEPELVECAGATVLAVPHGAPRAAVQSAAGGLEAAPGPRVVVAHGVAPGFEGRHGELGEADIAPEALGVGADYVALGHHHARARVGERAWYVGSTERFSIAEAGDQKVWHLVDLAAGQVEAHEVPTRPMLDLPVIDAKGRTPEEVHGAAHWALTRAPTAGAVVRLRVRGLAAAHRAAIDPVALRTAAPEALHLGIEVATDDDHQMSVLPEGARALPDAFDAFLAGRPLAGLDRPRLAALARAHLAGADG